MPKARRIRHLLRNLFRRGAVERELAGEIESTIELLTQEKVEAGMSEAEARRAARREIGGIGGIEVLKDEVRDVWSGRGLETTGRDLRHAWRRLRRRPAFAAVVVSVLALGIGSNTAMYSILRGVLDRPLPYAEPDRLVWLSETRPDQGITQNVVAGHEYPFYRDRNRSFEALSAITFSSSSYNLTDGGEPMALVGGRVTASFFGVMGVPPRLGRGFLLEEDEPGRGSVVVLSDSLWRSRFASDPAVVGRTIRLNDRPHSVVGVMPPSFGLARVWAQLPDPDLWVPIAEPIHRYRGRHFLGVVGRLKPQWTLGEAQAEMDLLAGQLAREDPEGNLGHGVRLVSLREQVVGRVRPALHALLLAVGFLLLVACANVASLILADAHARRKEMAVRGALGASRGRLLRQLLSESLLLGLLGGGLGMAGAWLAMHWLPRLSPLAIPRLDEVRLDGAVLAGNLVLSILATVLIGLPSALHGVKLRSPEWLKEGGRSPDGRDRQRVRRLLVVGEVALTLVLLAGAGLLLKSFHKLRNVDPGFAAERLLTLELALPASRYSDPSQVVSFYRGFLESLRQLPGVDSAGAAAMTPLAGGESRIALQIEGRPAVGPGDDSPVGFRVVSADYFRAMRIPLRRGRVFDASDARRAVPLIRWYPQQPNPVGFDEPQPEPVAVINEAMARHHWPGQDPLEQRVRVVFSPWVKVVGVVGDVRHATLRAEAGPELYLFDRQEPQPQMSVMVRTAGDPALLAASVRETLWSLDRGLPIRNLRPMEDVVSESVAQPRLFSFVFGAFSAMALLLTVVGVGGLISHMVGQRTQEFGIRVALGARPSALLRAVVGQGLALAATGALIGLAGALVLSRFLRGFLFGLEPDDPTTLSAVTAVLLVAALVASALPARRALRIDPASCLRHE
jgi:putative ABC transport system permease protein